MLRAGILIAAVAVALAGCGFAPMPGMGPTMRHPSSADVLETTQLPPMLTAPTISDEAMERAVEAGLARSEDETWRRIEGCLTPAPLAVGGNPFAAMRMGALDPRLSRARILKQQGLLDGRAIAELRKQVAESKFIITPEAIAKVLVDNGYLTPFQARRLVSQALGDEPDPAEHRAAEQAKTQRPKPVEDLTFADPADRAALAPPRDVELVELDQLQQEKKPAPSRPGAHRKNVVTVSTGKLDWSRPSTWTGAIDRSPCGTGTCARMAALHAKGQLPLGQDFVHEGILGTVFTGRVVEETTIGERRAIVPTISGQAWITGFASYVVDPTDPFPDGFTIGDIWA